MTGTTSSTACWRRLAALCAIRLPWSGLPRPGTAQARLQRVLLAVLLPHGVAALAVVGPRCCALEVQSRREEHAGDITRGGVACQAGASPLSSPSAHSPPTSCAHVGRGGLHPLHQHLARSSQVHLIQHLQGYGRWVPGAGRVGQAGQPALSACPAPSLDSALSAPRLGAGFGAQAGRRPACAPTNSMGLKPRHFRCACHPAAYLDAAAALGAVQLGSMVGGALVQAEVLRRAVDLSGGDEDAVVQELGRLLAVEEWHHPAGRRAGDEGWVGMGKGERAAKRKGCSVGWREAERSGPCTRPNPSQQTRAPALPTYRGTTLSSLDR